MRRTSPNRIKFALKILWLRITRRLKGHVSWDGPFQFGRNLHLEACEGGQIRIGANQVFGNHVQLIARGGYLRVGAQGHVGNFSSIVSFESITLGDRCLVAEMVCIHDHDHVMTDLDTPMNLQGRVTTPVIIGDNVWLGAKVTVTRGVTIGSGSVIGANAVVTVDIPGNSIAVGVPARVIRLRGLPV